MKKTNVSQPSEQYASFGLGRRNVFMWLASLFMLLSGALRIVYYSSPVEDAEGVGSTAFVLFFVVLPVVFCLWYAAALISKGSERLFTTCTPVFFGTAFLIYRACILFKSGAFGFNSGILLAANIVFCCMLYFIYRFAVNTGAKRAKSVAARRYIALIAFAAAAAIVFWQSGLLNIFRQPEGGITSFLGGISLFCAALAVILVFIGAKLNSDNMPLPACGDRSDGRRLRSLDPISGVGVYIMSRRNGANNLFRDGFECSAAEKYIHEKREEGLDKFGYTHLLLAAYVRTVSQRPAINRFIAGHRIYTRDGKIIVCMAIKKEMATDASETIIKVEFRPEDSVYDVYEKFNAAVEEAKASEELNSSFDKLAGLLNFIPGLLMEFTLWLIRVFDYFGKLPRILLKLSPFHGSMFVTSMGSLGIPPIYHHLYDFGNLPIFLAFGAKRRENFMLPDGTVQQKKYIDFTVTTDERICDGFYFASSIKFMKRCLANPERLDEKPESVVRDVD